MKFNLTDESREEKLFAFGTIMYVLCLAIIHNQIIHNFHRKYERSMLCCPLDGRGMENGEEGEK